MFITDIFKILHQNLSPGTCVTLQISRLFSHIWAAAPLQICWTVLNINYTYTYHHLRHAIEIASSSVCCAVPHQDVKTKKKRAVSFFPLPAPLLARLHPSVWVPRASEEEWKNMIGWSCYQSVMLTAHSASGSRDKYRVSTSNSYKIVFVHRRTIRKIKLKKELSALGCKQRKECCPSLMLFSHLAIAQSLLSWR